MIDGNLYIHHGDILRRDFMEPSGLSVDELASAIELPVSEIRAVLDGRDEISHDLARRLARQFRTSTTLWLNLSAGHYNESATAAIL